MATGKAGTVRARASAKAAPSRVRKLPGAAADEVAAAASQAA